METETDAPEHWAATPPDCAAPGYVCSCPHFKQCAALKFRCGCHHFMEPPAAVVALHELEVANRMNWCMQQGHNPAHEHLHLTEGDDTQFVYKVPPWKSDLHGNQIPNPCGIHFTPEDPVMKKLGCEQNDAQGWTCTRCEEWVAHAPRPYHGGEEPWDWWFCSACKAKAVKPPAKQREQDRVASQCCKITTYMS
jgi:hypothetical protein